MATFATPGPSLRDNLPASLTSFIGREHELAEVQTRLTDSRLLTLTGVGGCGKTRLALEVARGALNRYPDGVWLVELESLVEEELVPPTVAAVFNMRESAGQPIAIELATTLRERRLLLVLDNCEHLLDACASLADALLRACPDLRVLATSREALGITGEIAWRVPSLPVPDPDLLPPVAELRQNAAIRLFVERALAVQPDFGLSEHNAGAVAQVCQRLDGIPLALELAAARMDALTPEQVAARLDQRLRLLTGGSRTALPRQTTLRATLDWSYDLMSVPEQRLLNRLSVFAGGWTVEAAEAVCSGDGIQSEDVLDVLQSLIRKSLVIAEDGRDRARRYRLLETLRQYARERLVAAGEEELMHERHAAYWVSFVEGVHEPHWFTSAERVPPGLDRFLAERDNLRAALRWLSEHRRVHQAVQLGGRLSDVWVFGGYLIEGRSQLHNLLALAKGSPASPEYASLLWTAGYVEFFAGDYAAARGRWEEAVAMRRRINDPRLANALSYLGQVAREQEDYACARAWLEESLALSQRAGDQWESARTLDRLGTIAHAVRDYESARSRYEQSVAMARECNDRVEVCWSLHNLGCLALDEGDYRAARAYLVDSITSRIDADNIGFVHGLAEFACLTAAEGLPRAALRLAGATAALTQRTGIVVQHSERARYERWLATARQVLGEQAAEAAWAEGNRMRLDQAIAYALSPREPVEATGHTEARSAPASRQLTPREREVAALIAHGRSNRQIGEALVITERTVAAHVEHILNKLGFASRTQIGVWAAEHSETPADRTS